MAVPLPNAIFRPFLLVKPDADMVVADGDGLAGVGAELGRFAGKDEADDLLLEAGLLLGEEGFVVVVLVVVVVVVFFVGGGGGEEEEVVEGFVGEEVLGANLEPAHQSLEEEIVKVGAGDAVGEGAHRDFGGGGGGGGVFFCFFFGRGGVCKRRGF